MLKIIANIPIFVWPLFAILLLGGLKARKTSLVPLSALLAAPALFFCWALLSFFDRYAGEPLSIVFWLLCLGAGFLIGFSHLQRLKLRFDKEKKAIEMPGSWIPLILSMSVFTTKFSIGMMRGMLPHLNDSILMLCLELFSSVILGIFIGRAMGCFARYRSATMDIAK